MDNTGIPKLGRNVQIPTVWEALARRIEEDLSTRTEITLTERTALALAELVLIEVANGD